jgi:hypothetical protein
MLAGMQAVTNDDWMWHVKALNWASYKTKQKAKMQSTY